jgi:hypothetical protein
MLGFPGFANFDFDGMSRMVEQYLAEAKRTTENVVAMRHELVALRREMGMLHSTVAIQQSTIDTMKHQLQRVEQWQREQPSSYQSSRELATTQATAA